MGISMDYSTSDIFHEFLTYGLMYSTFFSIFITVRAVYRRLMSNTLGQNKFVTARQGARGEFIAPSRQGRSLHAHDHGTRYAGTLGATAALTGLASVGYDDAGADDFGHPHRLLSADDDHFELSSFGSMGGFIDTNPATGLPTMGGAGTVDIGGNAWGSASSWPD